MLDNLTEWLSASIEAFDNTLDDVAPHNLVLATATLYFLYNQYHNPWIGRNYRARHSSSYQQRLLNGLYALGKNLPPVKDYLGKELEKNRLSLEKKITDLRANMTLLKKMPEEETPVNAILKQFEIDITTCLFPFAANVEKKYLVKKGDGQDSGALYALYTKELEALLKEVYGSSLLSNRLHEKDPRIIAMEAEIISWSQELFHGSNEGYGVVTHGGTTSIIEAMFAYVKHARDKGIAYPEIVVPETAHEAFRKAAELTGATLIVVPVDKETGAVTAKEMRKYLSANTAVMVGSAPSFMNGIQDPIGELGQLAKEKNIPFHVDACLGGYLTAFLDTSDAPMDFRVSGVTSISTDTHKYGYTPKGTSLCLFSKDSPVLPIYKGLNWQGGLYTTPGLLDGSTSGARVAEIYTVLSYYGRKKYQEIAQAIVSLRQNLQEMIGALNSNTPAGKRDIYVFGDPQWSVLGFRSDTLNPHMIAEEMAKKNWKLNYLQNPAGFHLCLTHVHTEVEQFKERFIADLTAAITAVKQYPPGKKPEGEVKVYGTVGIMPTPIQEEACVQYQRSRLFYSDEIGGFDKVESAGITCQ